MNRADLLGLLREPLPPVRQQIDQPVLTRLATSFAGWYGRQERITLVDTLRGNLCLWLRQHLGECRGEIESLQRRHQEFRQRLSRLGDKEERERAVLEFARLLGSRGRTFRADRTALKRWFCADAITDRVSERTAEGERELVLGMNLLGAHAARWLAEEAPAELAGERWRRLDLEGLALPLFAHEGAAAVRLGAFRMLAQALRALPANLHETAVDAHAVQFIYRTAQEPRQDPWLQAESLLLLCEVSPPAAAEIVAQRVRAQRPGDDFFVRRRALRLACALLPEHPALASAIEATADDASDYVRQALAKECAELPGPLAEYLLPRLALADPAPPVRARAALAIASRYRDGNRDFLIDTLNRLLRGDSSSFVLRAGMLAARRIMQSLYDNPPAAAQALAALAPALTSLHESAPALKVRRWAAMCLEALRVDADPRARRHLEELREALGDEGERRRLPPELAALPEETLGRLAAVIAHDDFGLQFERHRRVAHVVRGHRFGRRLWRFLHEWRHPSPDKRQAFQHTIGRHFSGKLHAPSAILAELSPTKVPGEPLHFTSEDGWRPYLPLLDELLSLLDDPGDEPPLLIVTAEGVTAIRPPSYLLRRVAAAAVLNWKYAEFSRLRNWHEEGQQPPDAFVQRLRALGFEVHFTPWAENGRDPAVGRFFAGAALPLPLDDLWRRFENYFFSAYENTLGQLALFVGTSLSLFLGRHWLANRAQQRARATIPLVVGGWGTRGKSGTERLKAALFNGQGYSVLSKTTGCEAMFLYGAPFQPLREMFLFRPYDKATIWEQHNVTLLAARLKVDVMLWECMALTPSFVELLQRRWMRDDLSTITNAFPDHEDLQGPAGIDIPRVMTHFIPRRGQLFSSEKQMLPILAAAARRQETPLEAVGWLDSGLLTADIKARFPYEEHPDNIALVLRLAAHLGVDEDVALKDMADRVIPDLGVLKVFPPAAINGRRVSFANGMSANERYGCLNNWRRLGFDRHDPEESPDELICTVVNNRADRIARSRVFAGILVDDIAADFHFLIGSNLEGLLGYVRECWSARAAQISLWADAALPPEAVLELHARQLRLPFSAERVRARLTAMLKAPERAKVDDWETPDHLRERLRAASDPYADEIADSLTEELSIYREYQAWEERLGGFTGNEAARTALDRDFRAALWRWFERKIIVVADFHASGNEIVQLIARRTPPRLHNRVMGIQNIKGTGLDFVYRWLAWEQCHRACVQLGSRDVDEFRRGLNTLTSFTEFGVLTDDALSGAVARARSAAPAQNERWQAELAALDDRRRQAMVALAEQTEKHAARGRLDRFADTIEGFFDAGDAVWRRRQANRIYGDLVARRISQARAAEELMRLTQRQKGGWMAREIARQLQRQADLWRTIGLRLRRLAGWRKES